MKRALATVALIALALGATPSPPPVVPVPQGNEMGFGDWTVHFDLINFATESGDFEFPGAVYITRPGGDVRADSAHGNSDDNTLTLVGHVVMHDTRKRRATLTTDKLDIDGDAKVYVATGDVHYVQGDTSAVARDGKLDDTSKRLDLDGNVKIDRGTSQILADHVVYDTDTGKGHAVAKAGTITFPATQPSPSGSPSPSPAPSASPDDWVVHYTSADFNGKSGDFSIPGAVRVERGSGGDATADRASGNGKTKRATLFGHVVVHDVNGSFVARTGATQSSGPSTLTTDKLDMDDPAKRYVATGDVVYVHKDTTVDADKAVLDGNAHLLTMDGKVKILQPPKSLSADHVTYDTTTGDIHASSDPSRGVVTIFPGGPGPAIAPPKKITVRNPFSKKPAASPAPSPTPKP